jgi:hypothetical protein
MSSKIKKSLQSSLDAKHKRTVGNFKVTQLPAPNSTLAIGGVSSPFNSFVVAESFALRINTCGEKPAHRKSPKR